jgi:hypothetical protein
MAKQQAAVVAGRRARQEVPRSRRIYFRLTDEEYALVSAAAGRQGLSCGAYAGETAVAAAELRSAGIGPALREALVELMRAGALVRRAGVNLNQAVARLNATGQAGPDLEPAVSYCMRVLRRLDETAELVRRRLP